MLHSFNDTASDGYDPAADLTAFGGSLYGTTVNGGTGCVYSCGTVFKVTTSGAEQVLYSFGAIPDGAYPQAGLTILNGRLYGTTEAGRSCDSSHAAVESSFESLRNARSSPSAGARG